MDFDIDISPKRIVESDIVTDGIKRVDHLQNFLELSISEFAILVEVYYLNNEGTKPAFDQLREGYVEWYMKDISKRELENIIANLREKKFIKEGDTFEVNTRSVIEFIEDKNIKTINKLEDSVVSNIGYYLDRAYHALQRPLLIYLPIDELASTVLKNLKNHKLSKIYVTSNFPSELYTKKLLAVYSESDMEYFTMIRESISKEEVDAVLMTRFDVEELYEDALNALNNKQEALKECYKIVDSIRTLSEMPNFSMYYLKFPFGLDGVLPITRKPTDFILNIRDPRSRVTGGIYIKSPIIATHVKRVYEETINNAMKITNENCENMINALKRNLIKLYDRT